MFGIGTSEFLVILVVAVLVLGPEHLPRIMRTMTKVMSDFRRVSTDFQRTINLEASREEWKRQGSEADSRRTVKRKTSPAKKEKPAPAPDNAAEDAPLTADAPGAPESPDTPENPADSSADGSSRGNGA